MSWMTPLSSPELGWVPGTSAGACPYISIPSDVYRDALNPATGMPSASQQWESREGPSVTHRLHRTRTVAQAQLMGKTVEEVHPPPLPRCCKSCVPTERLGTLGHGTDGAHVTNASLRTAPRRGDSTSLLDQTFAGEALVFLRTHLILSLTYHQSESRIILPSASLPHCAGLTPPARQPQQPVGYRRREQGFCGAWVVLPSSRSTG